LALIRGLEESKAEAEALIALEEAHQKLPGEGALTAALATKLAKAGRSEEAARLYRELIQRAGNDPIALNNLAVLYADDLADPGQAVTFAERAYALSREPAIVDTLGWALYRRGAPGDLERARSLLESVRASLTSASARYHLGAVLLAAGAADDGRRLLSQALAQGEDFQGADHARSLLSAPAPGAK
jgi:Flp pilus assembly protein TadD